jgi:hypothetical protein
LPRFSVRSIYGGDRSEAWPVRFAARHAHSIGSVDRADGLPSNLIAQGDRGTHRAPRS